MKNRIKELREQRGLTQEQLGELVGASRQAINAIETEKFEPSIWLAYDISKVFECAIEEVFLFDVSLRKSRADSSRQEVKSGNKIRYDSDPILRKKCKAVLKVDDKIRQLLDDMLDTLHETENGAALAANQVGVLKRLVVIDFNDTRLKLVNPKMISQSGVQECVEGCLSFPNRFVKTIRPQKVTIQALNEYGEEIIVDGEDEMAKCFCHELEHLDGMIFLDKAIEELSVV